jgi:hypothetical protein
MDNNERLENILSSSSAFNKMCDDNSNRFMARDIANSQISFKSRTETPSRFEVTDAAGIQPNYIPDDMVE